MLGDKNGKAVCCQRSANIPHNDLKKKKNTAWVRPLDSCVCSDHFCSGDYVTIWRKIMHALQNADRHCSNEAPLIH